METDILNRIKKVNASPFLITRIRQRIANEKEELASKNVVWVFSFSFVFLLCINFVAFSKVDNKTSNTVVLAQSMNLMDDNTLYK